MTTTADRLTTDYLARLRRAARGLEPDRRDELLREIKLHLDEAIGPDASDAEALTVLDRLGEPEQIVDAEEPTAAIAADPRGKQEWAAIFLLLLGGLAWGVGWIAGVVLLWTSRAWTIGDKLIGTLLVPGGLATALYLGAVVEVGPATTCLRTATGSQCHGGMSSGAHVLFVVGFIALLLAPIGTAIFLARRARTGAL